jgi:hypothetical protein
MSINELPMELLTKISDYLEYPANFYNTSRYFNEINKDERERIINYVNSKYNNWEIRPKKVFSIEELKIVRFVAMKTNFTNYDVIAKLTLYPSVLEWAISKGAQNWLIISNTSARIGMLNLLQHAISLGIRMQPSWSYLSAANNQVNIIEFLISTAMISWSDAIKGAAYGGTIDLLNRLMTEANLPITIWTEIATMAAKGNNIQVFDLAMEKYDMFNWNMIASFAAKNNNIKMLLLAISHGVDNWSDILAKFGYTGNNELFRIAKEHGFEPDARTWEKIADNAAESGNLFIFNMAAQHSLGSFATLAILAAKGGHTEIFEKVIPEVYNRDNITSIADAAIDEGYLDILELMSNKIENWGEMMLFAGGSGYVEIYNYCKRNFDIKKWEEIALFAADKGDLTTIIKAIKNGARNYEEIIDDAEHPGYYFIANYVRKLQET